jgi:hypothetical protein
MANTKRKINSLIVCMLLLGSMIILNSRQVAAQTLQGTVYADVNMDGVFDSWLFAETPLAGADVFLNYPDTTYAPVTTTGASPNYGFSPVSAGFHCITVRCSGYKTVTRNINVLAGTTNFNIGLVPFESITGRAIKTDGTGVAGMHVDAWQGAVLQASAITDAYGNYCLHGLAPGVYDLHIWKPEYFDQWKLNIAVDGMTIGGTAYNWHTTSGVNFTNLSYDHGMIYGTVVPGAVVEVPGLGLSTTADFSGGFAIHNIPAGYYYVVAKKSGFETGVEFVCVQNGSSGPTLVPGFSLVSLKPGQPSAPIIEGTVTDGIQAIENAIVEIPGMTSTACPGGWTYQSGCELYTDKAGYYIFADYAGTDYIHDPLNPGKYTVVVRNEAGYDTDESDNHHKTAARVVVAQNDRVTRADFKLEENYGVKYGRVINTDGIGVEGARVYVPYSPFSTLTDSNGYFALELPSETYSENCDSEISPPANILPYKTGLGFTEMSYCGMFDDFQLNVVFTPLSSPRSAEPRRMHKARYLIKAERANYLITWEYYIPVPGGPGLYGVFPGEEPEPDPCNICENGIILNYKTGILKGQAYDSSGQPVTAGFVFVAGRDVPLQANGYFETHDVPIGTYTAAVIDPARVILGVETGIPVYYDQVTWKIINLSGTAGNYISGLIYSNKVILTGSGDVMPDPTGYNKGATFEPGEGIRAVTVETTATYTAVTDTYGFYCITGIPTTLTSTTIVATKSGYITIANPAVVPIPTLFFFPMLPGFPGFAGDAGATVSPMSKFRGSLSGRVINENGRDVTGAIVSIHGPHFNILGFPSYPWADETDTNGFYIFEDLEYGSYLLWVCGGGECGIDYKIAFSRGSPIAPVTVDGNVTKDITTEKTKGRVEGVVDDGTNPIVDAAVRVSGLYYSSTDSGGYYTVLNVPSGTHTAYAYRYGYQLQKHNGLDQSIGIAGGKIFPNADFTLSGGLSPGWIEGLMTLELTDGFCDIVARLNPSGDWVETDSEGYYLFTGLSSGNQYYVHGEKANYTTVQIVGPLAVTTGGSTWAQPVHLKRCTGTIDGYITDSQTGLPLIGATVKLSDMNRNDEVSVWYPGSDYYTDYIRSKIYETTTISAEPYTDSNSNGSWDPSEPYTDSNGNGQWDDDGYYQFTDVPWSDAVVSGLNKTHAWTIVVIHTGYAVGVHNAAVVCGSTSTVSFTVDPLCAVSGSVAFNSEECGSPATVEVTNFVGTEEGPDRYGWSTSGEYVNLTTGDTSALSNGDTYYIGHLYPGAYDVVGSTPTCTSAEDYTGANAVAVNYRTRTPDIDFTFGTLYGSGGSGGSGGESGEGSGGESGEGSGGESGEGSGGESGESGGSESGEGESGEGSEGESGGSEPLQPESAERSYQTDKLLREVASDTLHEAKVLQRKVYEALEQTDEVPDDVEELLNLADAYLEKALELFGQKDFAESIQWAEEAIEYYQKILDLLT